VAGGPGATDGVVSWAAHQFEGIALQREVGGRFRISYLGIVAGDQIPDFIAKFWTYGFTINGHHYGASNPARWQRGWPGVGWGHSVILGLILAALVYWRTGNKSFALGMILGLTAHALTDTFDSVGTMVFFPWVHRFHWNAWRYAAQAGRYRDAGAYYSSLGFVMDAVWLVVVALFCRKMLQREYWRSVVVPADPQTWGWLSRRFPEEALVVFYRVFLFYGLGRFLGWTLWSHVTHHFPWDLHWGGPAWMPRAHP
jgi:membrane-bound metal-dependent hydrolase YbcI (DUF457 family)